MPTVVVANNQDPFDNASIRPGENVRGERIQVHGTTLRECILNYGLATGKRVEASDRAPYFRFLQANIFGEDSSFCCRVRRGSQVIQPTSFDWLIEDADEIEIELLVC